MNRAEWSFHARNESETASLGSAIATALQPGAVLTLLGELGAGKTCLVRSIATGLGVDSLSVASPTFVLIREYIGRLPVFHFDVYRLTDTEEFLELGADELLYGQGVCLIEWADRVASVLPADVLEVRIAATGQHARTIELRAGGAGSQQLLDATRRAI
jgi:tRNA threonylcarbamoyladenosine biosynthesis protein TsaE